MIALILPRLEIPFKPPKRDHIGARGEPLTLYATVAASRDALWRAGGFWWQPRDFRAVLTTIFSVWTNKPNPLGATC